VSINEESKAHRARPVDFALKLLAELFGHYSTEEQSYDLWEEQINTAMWYADDALFCLKELLANPPDNLSERLNDIPGGSLVFANHPEKRGGLSNDEQLILWIREVTDRLEERFRNKILQQPPKNIEETSIQFANSAIEAIEITRDEIPFWATDIGCNAESAKDGWGEGAWHVRLRYTLPYP